MESWSFGVTAPEHNAPVLHRLMIPVFISRGQLL